MMSESGAIETSLIHLCRALINLLKIIRF